MPVAPPSPLPPSLARARRYFQWRPEHNENSASHTVQAGDLLYGSLTYDARRNSMVIYHNVSGSTSWEVTTVIPIQSGSNGVPKNYSIAYIVYEKDAPCGDYPPDGVVTFTNIHLACDGKPYTPKWKTSFVDDVCNNRATVVDPATVKITWNTKAADPPAEMIAASQAVKGLHKRVPAAVRARHSVA